MSYLFYLLLIIYLLIFLALLIFIDQHERNYWRRALIPLKPCPFPDPRTHFKEVEIIGTRSGRQGLLSYSLYGNYPKYAPTLIESLKRISDLLPDWQARVYVGLDIPDQIKEDLLTYEAEVVVMGPHRPLGHEAALWRFLPAEGDLPFVCLDADDLFNESNVKQIRDWLKTDQPFCSTHWVIFALPMTANAWGARPGAIADIRERINRYCEHGYGFDEAFLKKEVWPVAVAKGCWTPTWIRLDKLLPVFWLVIILLMVASLYLAYRWV